MHPSQRENQRAAAWNCWFSYTGDVFSLLRSSHGERGGGGKEVPTPNHVPVQGGNLEAAPCRFEVPPHLSTLSWLQVFCWKDALHSVTQIDFNIQE